MNEIEMLEVTRRHQSELRQLAKVIRPIADPAPSAGRLETELGSLGSRLREAWQATLRPLRPLVGGPR